MQLKRFDFDWERNEPIKYNDFFEFPLEIDMEPYTAQGIEARENLESPQPQDMFVSSGRCSIKFDFYLIFKMTTIPQCKPTQCTLETLPN